MYSRYTSSSFPFISKSAKSGQIFSDDDNDSDKNSDSDSDDEFTPGTVALEFRVRNFGKNISNEFNEFLRKELENKDDEDPDDNSGDEADDQVLLPDANIGEELEKQDSIKFLKSMGFRPPSNQHNTWRIPGGLNREKCLRILGDLAKKDSDDSSSDERAIKEDANQESKNPLNIFSDGETDKESSDDDLITQMPKKRKASQSSNAENSPLNSEKKRRKVTASISDSEEEGEAPAEGRVEAQKDERLKAISDSESESDEMILKDTVSSEGVSKKKKIIFSSDEED